MVEIESNVLENVLVRPTPDLEYTLNFLSLAKSKDAVLEAFLEEMSSSTLHATIVSRLQKVEILPSRKVNPMKVHLVRTSTAN